MCYFFVILSLIITSTLSGCFKIHEENNNPQIPLQSYQPAQVNHPLHPIQPAQKKKPVRAVSIFSGYYASSIIDDQNQQVFETGNNQMNQLDLGYETVFHFFMPQKTIKEKIIKMLFLPSFSLALTEDGTLYAVGENTWGQFGRGGSLSLLHFTPIAHHIIDVAAGIDFIAYIEENGFLQTAGHNNHGQLGTGDTIDHPYFLSVAANIRGITAGPDFLLSLTTDGFLLVNGENNAGQLGNGTQKDILKPTPIMTGVVAAACGENFTVLLLNDGSLYGIGDSTKGQLGLAHLLWLTPKPILMNMPIRKIAAGRAHTLVLIENTLLGTGDNRFGQLGHTATQIEHFKQLATHVRDMAASANGSFYIDEHRRVYATGRNQSGELGLGYLKEAHRFEPVFYKREENGHVENYC